MFKKIKNFGKDELISGSLILFFMMNFFNFLNYVFQFVMARMLGPADYGLLAVLMSISYVFTVPNEAIQTIVSRITSTLNAKKEFGKMKFIFYKTLKKCLKTATICFVLFVPLAVFLSYFLPDVTFYHLVFPGIILFGAFSLPVVRGVLQGRKKFKKLGWSMIFEGMLKLIAAIFLVFIGLNVYGAISGVILGIFFSFLLSLVFIKEILRSKEEKADINNVSSYSKPIISSIFVIMVMLSLDIILAKRFFPSEIAGKYAVISMLGKIIFFGTYAIGKTMFPLVSEGNAMGKDTSKVFKKSIKIVSVLCAVALLIYLFFPKLVIRILFGPIYVDAYNILFIVGLAFSFLSFSNIIILYNLSIDKIKRGSTLIIFIIIEALLLSVFHSSLLEFSLAFLAVNFLMFVYNLSLLKK